MKNIIKIAVIAIIFTSCKKKEVAPMPQEPVCVTSPDQFSGKYVSVNNDTIEVIFLHNNCPKNKSNTCLVKKIGEAVQSILKPSETIEKKDYEIIVDGNTNFGTYSNEFSLNRENTGNLIFSSYKAYYSLKFTKI